MKSNKAIIIGLVVLAALATASVGGYYYLKTKDSTNTNDANTEDAGVKTEETLQTTETVVKPSTATPSVTENPIPAGLAGPSGSPEPPVVK